MWIQVLVLLFIRCETDDFLTSLCSCFLIWKVRTVIVLPSKVVVIFGRGKIYKARCLEHSKCSINISLYYLLIFYLRFIMAWMGK